VSQKKNSYPVVPALVLFFPLQIAVRTLINPLPSLAFFFTRVLGGILLLSALTSSPFFSFSVAEDPIFLLSSYWRAVSFSLVDSIQEGG